MQGMTKPPLLALCACLLAHAENAPPRQTSGDTVVQPGTYRLRNAVFLASHVRLIGEGEKTIILKEPSATITRFATEVEKK